jgi:hypothetical protein
MVSEGQEAGRIEALRALMDRLASPDLSLGEAKGLRCRLMELTGSGRDEGEAPQENSPSLSCEGRQGEPRFPGCRSCAA